MALFRPPGPPLDTRSLTTMTERIKSGNPEADYILGGGFPVNSINS